MDHKELCSLADIYQFIDLNQAKLTFYIPQFLWQDLTSKFDIVGPYYFFPLRNHGKQVCSFLYL